MTKYIVIVVVVVLVFLFMKKKKEQAATQTTTANNSHLLNLMNNAPQFMSPPTTLPGTPVILITQPANSNNGVTPGNNFLQTNTLMA